MLTISDKEKLVLEVLRDVQDATLADYLFELNDIEMELSRIIEATILLGL